MFPVRSVSIAGMNISCLSRQDIASQFIEFCGGDEQRQSRTIMDANGHALSLFNTDSSYRKSVEQADMVHADGQFLLLVSRLLGKPIAERSATTDLIHDIAAMSVGNSVRFYLLGGDEGTNRAASEILKQKYPLLEIAGRHHGYFAVSELVSVCADIDNSNANIVWVGLGKPLEQAVALKIKSHCQGLWVVTCGGCFNYITGKYTRAPLLMQKLGIEWVHRAATGPRSLIFRYMITTPHAIWLSVVSVAKHALSGGK